MGCEASDNMEIEALDEELQQELNMTSYNKRDQQIDRFQSNKPQEGFDSIFQAQEETDEQFMAVKPWIGALVKPSDPPQFNRDPPGKSLKLAFVNGFKVEDSRQNMFWGKNKDEITYCAAAVGIVMNVNSLQQRYMGAGQQKSTNGHTDDIISLGLNQDRKLVVTGSLGAKPLILVWDSDSMQVIARTNLGRNTRAVSSIRFSRNGKYFFCTDKHNDSNVYVFQAMTAKLLGTSKCGSDPVFDGQSGNNNSFGVATKRGFWLFNYDGNSLEKKKGIFNGNPMQTMITVTFSPQSNCFFTGSGKGDIYRWQGNSCLKSVNYHNGAVMGLAWASGKLLSSGSKDNILKVSNSELQTLATFDLPSYAKSIDLLNGRLLVATKCGRILTIDEKSSAKKQVMHGHSQGQTWGLAIGNDGMVYSTADDNQILCFNPKICKVQKQGIINKQRGRKYKIGGASTLSTLPPNQHARAIAINKKGHVIIGRNDGTVGVRTIQDLNTSIFDEKIGKQWIEVIKYSPDQSKVAIGSHDNNIYILKVDGDSYFVQGVCKAHNSFITNLDWSKDSRYIHSNCGAYQYLFFDVSSKIQLKSGASQLKDEKWATYTVKLGWWVQGIFPPATSGDHVNGVDRNHGEDIIATGDDWGMVNLYRNPALKGVKGTAYRAHSSHVVRVMFDQKDQYLYSVGGYDKTLMMWKVQ